MGGINRREHLLQTGQEIIWQKGYDRCSVKDITTAAGLPKGSFYHYFESKEKFALEAMNNFIESAPERLPNQDITINTFSKVIDARINSIIKINYSRECYMSVMCHSYSEQDDAFRLEVLKAIEQSNESMRELLTSLKQAKLISASLKIDDLMEYIDFTWRGARLKARLSKSKEPLLLFKKFLIDYILKV